MTDYDGRERIARALRGLAADLVAEKQRVAVLRRENRELRSELSALRTIVNGSVTDGVGSEDVSVQSAVSQMPVRPRTQPAPDPSPTGRSASPSRAG
jgi:hypothetical protein